MGKASFALLLIFVFLLSVYATHNTYNAPERQVKLYIDSDLSSELRSIDWGNLSKGEQKTHLAYIKNTSNNKKSISLRTGGYKPAYMADHLSLGWNLTEPTIGSQGMLPVLFTLAVALTATVGDFSFDIVLESGEV